MVHDQIVNDLIFDIM